eukprot:TRINITY_DN52187_c0_g1_i1.p1 TRINITY_DN52187_c0_g1~~TRINITY_DN52187_c0_g1_i1.p1  ORF type:complete len:767 (-),score=72.42 TRINITY_DN52187_c0_g1_i1:37-2337(-)
MPNFLTRLGLVWSLCFLLQFSLAKVLTRESVPDLLAHNLRDWAKEVQSKPQSEGGDTHADVQQLLAYLTTHDKMGISVEFQSLAKRMVDKYGGTVLNEPTKTGDRHLVGHPLTKSRHVKAAMGHLVHILTHDDSTYSYCPGKMAFCAENKRCVMSCAWCMAYPNIYNSACSTSSAQVESATLTKLRNDRALTLIQQSVQQQQTEQHQQILATQPEKFTTTGSQKFRSANMEEPPPPPSLDDDDDDEGPLDDDDGPVTTCTGGYICGSSHVQSCCGDCHGFALPNHELCMCEDPFLNNENPSVWQVLAKDERISTFALLLQLVYTPETLPNCPGSIILAPSNDALEMQPADLLKGLLDEKNHGFLEKIVKLHVLPSDITPIILKSGRKGYGSDYDGHYVEWDSRRRVFHSTFNSNGGRVLATERTDDGLAITIIDGMLVPGVHCQQFWKNEQWTCGDLGNFCQTSDDCSEDERCTRLEEKGIAWDNCRGCDDDLRAKIIPLTANIDGCSCIKHCLSECFGQLNGRPCSKGRCCDGECLAPDCSRAIFYGDECPSPDPTCWSKGMCIKDKCVGVQDTCSYPSTSTSLCVSAAGHFGGCGVFDSCMPAAFAFNNGFGDNARDGKPAGEGGVCNRYTRTCRCPDVIEQLPSNWIDAAYQQYHDEDFPIERSLENRMPDWKDTFVSGFSRLCGCSSDDKCVYIIPAEQCTQQDALRGTPCWLGGNPGRIGHCQAEWKRRTIYPEDETFLDDPVIWSICKDDGLEGTQDEYF